jgi:septal ring factor EnvC (AmiA/AmiB activator)
LIKIKQDSQDSNKNSEKAQQIIMNLNSHLDEAKVIEETLKDQLKEKQCLEDEIVSQIKETEKREEILISHLKEILEDLNTLEVEFSQQEKKLEEQIITLKTQLEGAKRMEEVRKI